VNADSTPLGRLGNRGHFNAGHKAQSKAISRNTGLCPSAGGVVIGEGKDVDPGERGSFENLGRRLFAV
jgi:hypothetical protein